MLQPENLLHLLFPFANGGNIGFVRQGFQSPDFLRREVSVCRLCRIFHMTNFCHANDGKRSLGNSPCRADLRYGEAVPFADFFHSRREFCQLRQDRIITLGAIRPFREGVSRVVFAGKCALLQYHIGKKSNVVFPAILQYAGAFRGTVEQTEMILHRLKLVSQSLQYLLWLDTPTALTLPLLKRGASSGVQRSTSAGLWIQ